MWAKRGCCGLVDLKTQTTTIAAICCIFSFIALIYGFVMIQNPQKIFGAKHAVEEFVNQQVDEEEASMVEAEEEFAITEKIKNGTISPAKNELHEAALKHITTQGIKMVVMSLVTFALSILLAMGSRQNKSLYFVPWLTEQFIALSVGVVTTVILALGNQLGHVSATHGAFVVLIFLLNAFFIYSVMSHFVLLRRMKRHTREIINTVVSGNGYQTTNYERMTAELGREMQVVPPGRPRADEKEHDDVMYFSI